MSLVAFCVLASAPVGSSSAADAFRATLTLDPLSFVSFGDDRVFSIPAGTKLAFRFPDSPSENLAFEIHPDDVASAEIPIGTAESLVVGLARPAKGVLRASDDGWTMSFDARLRVQIERPIEPRMREIDVRFTTESATAKSTDGSRSISVSGLRLQPSALAIQLVGARSGDAADYPLAGGPIYAVLSGAFDRLPKLQKAPVR
ncbi:MAG: hypothetical protein DCC71_16785 [Proteobacteria bacterium]|nr:MAG: hypothetical protein DCC71_16785 [Pseudomonadota bacterium]